MLYKKDIFKEYSVWAEKLFTIYFHERGQKKMAKMMKKDRKSQNDNSLSFKMKNK